MEVILIHTCTPRELILTKVGTLWDELNKQNHSKLVLSELKKYHSEPEGS